MSFIASLISISPDGVAKGIGNYEFVVTPRVGEKFSVDSPYATEEYEVVKLEHWPVEVPKDELRKRFPECLFIAVIWGSLTKITKALTRSVCLLRRSRLRQIELCEWLFEWLLSTERDIARQ